MAKGVRLDIEMGWRQSLHCPDTGAGTDVQDFLWVNERGEVKSASEGHLVHVVG